MVLGVSLTGAALNTSKQFKKTDNRFKATDLAEMGISYFLQVNNSVLQEAKNIIASQTNPNFCTQFTTILKDKSNTRGYYVSKTVDLNNNYQIILDINNITPCTSNPDQVNVVFYSIGTTDTNEQAKLKGTFVLSRKLNREGELAPQKPNFINGTINGTYPDNSKVFIDGTTTFSGNDGKTINYNVWFNQLVLHGNGFVIGDYDGIFTDSSQNGNTNITLYGDAIFLSKPSKFVGNASMCVKGNVYYVDKTVDPNGRLVRFTDFDINYRNYCSSNNSEWFIDANNGVQVDYNQ
jgi:hypothetical protein